jgi:transcriptional regulator GlxA family with amidase domain
MTIEIAIPIYDGITVLDAIGPYEPLSRLPGAEIRFVGAEAGPKQATTSVCTGALLLRKAGVLDGLRATTHWAHLERLPEYGAEPTTERVVEEGKVVTAAGVSSGIDMALRLIQLEAGDQVAEAIQLAIEYDPQPPVDAGSPKKAGPEIVELVRAAELGEHG